MKKETIEAIFSELKNMVNELSFECLGCRLVKEDGLYFLRVYLDVEGSVDLQDCETVARGITEYLDSVAEELPERYMLEVTSPGLERPLFIPEDFETFKGKPAELELKENKKLVCVLNGAKEEGIVSVIAEKCERDIKFEDIKFAHLIYKKEGGEKKVLKKTPKKKKK